MSRLTDMRTQALVLLRNIQELQALLRKRKIDALQLESAVASVASSASSMLSAFSEVTPATSSSKFSPALPSFGTVTTKSAHSCDIDLEALTSYISVSIRDMMKGLNKIYSATDNTRSTNVVINKLVTLYGKLLQCSNVISTQQSRNSHVFAFPGPPQSTRKRPQSALPPRPSNMSEKNKRRPASALQPSAICNSKSASKSLTAEMATAIQNASDGLTTIKTALEPQATQTGPEKVSKAAIDTRDYLFQLLALMGKLLDRSKPAHRELLEGYAFLLLSHAGKVLGLATFKEDVTRPLGSMDGRTNETKALDVSAALQQAPYIIWALKQMMPQIRMNEQLLADVDDQTSLSRFARARLQNTLLRAVFGEKHREFAQGLRLPQTLDLQKEQSPSHSASDDVASWFTSEVWRLVGWDALGRTLDA